MHRHTDGPGSEMLPKSYAAWVGRTVQGEDQVDLRTARALAATLDLDPATIAPGSVLPPLWHWVYFTPQARRSELGPDGHPRRGGFLPPIDLPNRMWAGGRFRFERPLHVGEAVRRDSRLLRCEAKHGRTGELVFVTVEHTLHGPGGVALVEEHDIVYREAVRPGGPLAGGPIESTAQFRRPVQPDPVLLFRYSALTFNGHRIHYDHPYATEVEGYPGLVFHGPLTATLLMEAFRAEHPGARVRTFDYRALGPLFDTTGFDVCGRLTGDGRAQLWTECDARVTLRAELSFD